MYLRKTISSPLPEYARSRHLCFAWWNDVIAATFHQIASSTSLIHLNLARAAFYYSPLARLETLAPRWQYTQPLTNHTNAPEQTGTLYLRLFTAVRIDSTSAIASL